MNKSSENILKKAMKDPSLKLPHAERMTYLIENQQNRMPAVRND